MSNPAPDVKSIFGRALGMGPTAERAEYLDQACGGNTGLRAEVESLLQALDQAGNFLNHHADAPVETAAHEPASGERGRWIGPYKLLQQIGEGGMGVVYMAEQEHPVRRRVALKIIKPGMDSAQVIARFEAERQALAMMDHLNIAKVLDAGTIPSPLAPGGRGVGGEGEGLPYFAMELVHGVSITRYCDDNRLTPRERLDLFVPVCQAIQHAHQKGIIHRDIKPSNILVTLYDGKPVPKVIDFGVAKATEQRLTDQTMFTQYGAAVGTYEYMSPEQAEMSGLGIDTRSDIYSLGVLLYELLTGTTPLERTNLREAAFTEMIRMIREVEPSRPSVQLSSSDTLPKIAAARKTEPAKLAKLVKGELDWIVMKCLEKDRTRRYETANGLARDVQRYLADESVEACPPSTAYRLRRFARKYRGALTAAVTFVLLLLSGTAVCAWLAVRATHAEQRMEAERDRALASQKELQQALTRQVAERLEKDLQQFATLGQALAAMMAHREDWNEKQLKDWMEELLAKEERVFGLFVAFEPGEFHGKQDYSLYTSRSGAGGTIYTRPLLPPKYPYRKLPLYKQARATNRAFWSEPFFDQEGGNIWMVSHEIPFQREKRFAGATTVDLSVKYFSRLRDWLAGQDVKLGEGSYGFIISDAGTIISHPHTDYDLWKPQQQPPPTRQTKPPNILNLPGADPDFVALVRRMQTEGTGSGTAIDPTTGKRSIFLFAPVRPAGWTFVAVLPVP